MMDSVFYENYRFKKQFCLKRIHHGYLPENFSRFSGQLLLKITLDIFFGIHSMKGGTDNMRHERRNRQHETSWIVSWRHGVTRKRSTKR